MTLLTQSLLNEKNSEIDELTAEVERLSTEIERRKAAETHQLPSTSVFIDIPSTFFAVVQYFMLLGSL